MENPDRVDNEAASPLGSLYQVADPRALRHVHAETLHWFLEYLGRSDLVEFIDRVVLIGWRAGGYDLDGVLDRLPCTSS